MTVSSTTARQTYIGDGSLATYSYNFRIFDAGDLVLVKRDTATGIETLLALTTDYTVTGAGGYNGGTFTLLAGVLPSGYELAAYRELDLLQSTDLRNQGTFLAEIHERVFDRLMMIAQQLQDQLNRSIRLPDSEAGGDLLKLPAKEIRAGKQMTFDPTTADPTVSSPATAAVSAAMEPVVGSANLALARAALAIGTEMGPVMNAATLDLAATAFEFKATGGTADRSLADRASDVVNVKDFGAIGDGSDETAKIQAAIDSLTNGGTVEIPAGTYIFTSIEVKTGVTLKGAGGVLKLKSNTCVNAGTAYYLIHNIGHTNVRYESLIIDGNMANNALYLVADAITATGAGVVVRDCYIYNTPDSGIMFSDAPRGMCYGNRIETGGDLGIYVNGSEGGSNRATMSVCGNIIDGFPFGGVGVKRSAENVTVSNNIITNCGNGITVEDFGVGAGGAPDHLIITSNTMRGIGYTKRGTDVAEAGIVLNFCTNVIVSNNKIEGVSGFGIDLGGATDCIISNNHLIGYAASPGASGNTGLYAAVRTAVTPTRNTILGNQFIGFYHYGARLTALTASLVCDNVFSATQTGVRFDADCDTNTISRNRISGTPDVEYYTGASFNIMLHNYLASGGTAWEKAGHVRSISVATPVGNITPAFPGQLCWITTGGPKIFMAYGLADTEWVQIG